MIDRSRQLAFGLVLILALAAQARADAGKTEKPGPLKGQIAVSPQTGMLEGRSLFIDGHEIAVSQNRFSVKRAGARYDAWLLDKAKRAVTIYQGLTRRDPVLRVAGNGQAPSMAYQATLHGILRGDFPFPVERGRGLNVYLFAEGASSFWQAHPLEWGDGQSAGPRFGRMRVHWSGARAIAGELYAVGEIAEEKRRWVGAWLAHAPVTLSEGAEVFQEMTMQALPAGHIAGSVSIAGKDVVREIGFDYRLPGKSNRLALGSCPVLNTYDCRLPDLSSLGGEYCAHIYFQFPVRYQSNGNSTRCAGKLGMTDFSFHVAAEPQWVGVSRATSMTPKTVLHWKDQGPGVYQVILSASYDSKKTGPAIIIYTGQSSVRWPDLSDVGLDFPAGASYGIKVTRYSPCLSVDELTSAKGWDKSADYEEAEAPPLELNMEKP